MHAQSLSQVWLFATPRTIAYQASLYMGFPKQEHWSELPFPSPGEISDPGIEPMTPELADWFFTIEGPLKPHISKEQYEKLHDSSKSGI